jgi:hypothetical protein
MPFLDLDWVRGSFDRQIQLVSQVAHEYELHNVLDRFRLASLWLTPFILSRVTLGPLPSWMTGLKRQEFSFGSPTRNQRNSSIFRKLDMQHG